MEAPRTKEEALREKILEAAQQLFQRYGLRKVTMDDIARAAGRGKSSLYYYYKSKDEIFDVVIDRESNSILSQIAQQISRLPTAGAKLEAFALTKVQLLREKSALYGLLYQDIYLYYSLDFANRMRLRYQASETALVTGILAEGMAQGAFRKMSEAEIAQAALMLVTCLYGFEQGMLAEGVPADLESHLKLLLELLVRGLKP